MKNKTVSFKARPELKATRDEILYLGIKAPWRLKELIEVLPKNSHDIIYEHAIVGRQFAHIGRDFHYTPEQMVRWWTKAVAEYHERYKTMEG